MLSYLDERGATPPSASSQYGVLGGVGNRPSNRPPSPPKAAPMPPQNPPMFAGGPPGLATAPGHMLHGAGNPIYSRQQSAEMLYARQLSSGSADIGGQDTYSTRAQLAQHQALTSQG